MKTTDRVPKDRQHTVGRPEVCDAFIAFLIGAMNPSAHVSPEEGARTSHHIIWSTRRFRRKSGETVRRMIETSRYWKRRNVERTPDDDYYAHPVSC